VPVIRDHHEGYVNKFLGDGIMFFYGAPRETPHHAADAVSTVLDMYTTTERFNLTLQERGLPTIALRAGISSGVMVVGDAGGGGAADYTVLGDNVNLASRLEAANKAVGTRTLITARTAELLDGQFILRPVGRLKVVGKDEAVMTFEPIARAGEATDDVRRMAQMFGAMVEKFCARDFAGCIDMAREIDEAGGHLKLAGLYRELSERYLREPPGEDFDGRIVLTEK
jgi:adenylate cyclase